MKDPRHKTKGQAVSVRPFPMVCHLQRSPFSLEKKEQAEVGQSLTCLPLRYRKGRLGNPPGVPMAAGSGVGKEKGTPGRGLYICLAVYTFSGIYS